MDDINDGDNQVVPDGTPAATAASPNQQDHIASIEEQTKVAHLAAIAAANTLVNDSEHLLGSLRDLALSSFDVGSTSAAPASCRASPALHENKERKRRVWAKRAVDSAKKLRRSNRLAAKEEANFVDMVSKAIKAKAASFDLSTATADITFALNESGLADRPEVPHEDADALAAVALACGADEEAAASISDDEVTPKSP
jgi:hypothetical protein